MSFISWCIFQDIHISLIYTMPVVKQKHNMNEWAAREFSVTTDCVQMQRNVLSHINTQSTVVQFHNHTLICAAHIIINVVNLCVLSVNHLTHTSLYYYSRNLLENAKRNYSNVLNNFFVAVIQLCSSEWNNAAVASHFDLCVWNKQLFVASVSTHDLALYLRISSIIHTS